jgi:hypothetical protein
MSNWHLASIRTFDDSDSTLVFDFKEKSKKLKHRSNSILESSSSPNPGWMGI